MRKRQETWPEAGVLKILDPLDGKSIYEKVNDRIAQKAQEDQEAQEAQGAQNVGESREVEAPSQSTAPSNLRDEQTYRYRSDSDSPLLTETKYDEDGDTVMKDG